MISNYTARALTTQHLMKGSIANYRLLLIGLGRMANPKKFQAMVLGARKHDFCFKADNTVIDEYDNIDLLGINVDNHLKFEKHTSNICKINFKRVNKQLQVLKRFRNLVSSYHLTLNLVFITEGFRVTYFSSLFLCLVFLWC